MNTAVNRTCAAEILRGDHEAVIEVFQHRLGMRAHGCNGVFAQLQAQRRLLRFQCLIDRRGGFQWIANLCAVHTPSKFAGAADALSICIGNRHLPRTRPQEIGSEVAGLYEQNFDAEGGNFLRQRFRDSFERELGCGIGAETGE